MQKPLKLTEEETLTPFSPEGFAARARLSGLPLDKAGGWPRSQSPTELTPGTGSTRTGMLTKI